MGRSRECELLITGQQDTKNAGSAVSKRIQLPIEQRLERWKLSPAQKAAAAKALRFVEEHRPESSQLQKTKMFSLKSVPPIRNFLLWAVTGAGKTEMIFPLVESVLLRGGRALIATPRRDVVIELDPRIRRAFPDSTVVTLYGGSDQRWEAGDITLSTTHQLLRFNEGFDLVIIDELDAFPYHGDPILQYAADKSCAPGAARLLLSATPPNELQRAARSGKLPHARVPVRYHRHPLPVPQLLATPAVAQMLQKRRLPAKLLAALRQSLKRDAQLFIFVQKIVQTEPMAELLRAELRYSDIEATSSQDNERTEKVQRFRAREIRVLVTTTILERGVTIPRSDVYILDAGGRLFDEASLVQMAGRAGRSADDPFGRVYFCSRERNRCQIAAVRHIKTMNRIARKQGYLLPANRGGSPQ
jgi:competence protein ComFA